MGMELIWYKLLTVNQEMKVRFFLSPQEFLQEVQSSSLQYLMPSFLKVL